MTQISSVSQNIWAQTAASLKLPVDPQRQTISMNPAAGSILKLPQPTARPALTLEAASAAIKKINEAANQSRVTDIQNGVGLINGASAFGTAVADAYQFLTAVAPLRQGSDRELLGLAAHYSMAKGSELLVPGSEPSVSLLKPIDDFLGKNGSQLVGAIGAAYSIYELVQGQSNPLAGAIQGMTTGAYLGSYLGPIGMSAGAIVGGLGGMVSGLFKSGKPADQKERDLIRKQLQALGILDSDWNIKLANGALFDFGKDGGAKLQNIDGTLRRYKEFDMSNPLTEPVAQLLAPLAESIAGANPRLAAEFTAYLTNAANSNSTKIEDSIANIKVLYSQFGLSFENVLKKMAA